MKRMKIATLTMTLLVSSLFFFSFLIPSPGERWMAPEGAKQLKNPLELNEKTVKMGKAIFNVYCKACHGKYGKGDGPSASGLDVRCADLTSPLVQSQSDGEIYYKLSVGRGVMPQFKGIIQKPEERWQLVNYIRSLRDPQVGFNK